MPGEFDRRRLRMFPLSERKHKLDIERIAVSPDTPVDLPEREMAQIESAAKSIISARQAGSPVVLSYGAHLIKNGGAPIIIRMIEDGWVTHIATNGAGSIHDWEFAFTGLSTEDVRENTAQGRFGTWDETGRSIGLAVAVGGTEGLGYGWSVGKMIAEDKLRIPSREDLRADINSAISGNAGEKIGALSDMLYLVSEFNIPEGWMQIPHPFKHYSVQHAAYSKGIPFTVHPGIGYDIIYTHPMTCGGAIGRGSVWDFLIYADSISRLQGGVHLSVGSAIMSPMIFEKSLSMANNLAMTEGRHPLSDYSLVVVDIQDGGGWDWGQGEPPMDNPAYYLRFCKSFYRMGGHLDYICLDNIRFMLGLYQVLEHKG